MASPMTSSPPTQPDPIHTRHSYTQDAPLTSALEPTTTTTQVLSSSPTLADDEFDPCQTLNPCSPFYLYKHDSPRPSMDQAKLKPGLANNAPVRIAVHELDLERGNSLTPAQSRTVTTATPRLSSEKTLCKEDGRRGFNLSRLGMGKNKTGVKRCMTKPKQKWLAHLTKRQRLGVKLLIAVVVGGALIGTIVGIAIRTHSGIYKSNNSQTVIG